MITRHIIEIPLKPSDIDQLRMAVDLLKLGRNIILEYTEDTGVECVEVVKFSPETEAALKEQPIPIQSNDLRKWLESNGDGDEEEGSAGSHD